MGRHIIRAFEGMFEDRIAIRNQSCEQAFEVAADTGVGILADDQRGAGVLHENVTEAVLYAGGTHCGGYLGGNVIGATPARPLVKGFLMGHAVKAMLWGQARV